MEVGKEQQKTSAEETVGRERGCAGTCAEREREGLRRHCSVVRGSEKTTGFGPIGLGPSAQAPLKRDLSLLVALVRASRFR
ncbi:hypothetical protein NL676_020504 [Syzygium grande]|nr:hypothetical protein NL676_020504 [Syzygium grande]